MSRKKPFRWGAAASLSLQLSSYFASAQELPGYLSPESQRAVESMRSVLESYDAVGGMIVGGVLIQSAEAPSADPEHVAASAAVEVARRTYDMVGPTPNTGELAGEALRGLPELAWQQIRDVAYLQCTDVFTDSCNPDERAFWERMREGLDGDMEFDDFDHLVAYAAGEPHFRTADGLRYDLQLAGDVVFLRSLDDSLEIQLRLEPWEERAVTAIAAVAVRIGSQTILADSAPLRLRIDGADVTAPRSVLADGSVVVRDATSCTLLTPSGDQIQIESVNAKMFHVAVSPDLSRRGQLGGLIGDFNGERDDDLRVRGEAGSEPLDRLRDCPWLHGVFGASWRVPTEATLFDTPSAPPGGAFATTDFPICAALRSSARDDLPTLVASCTALGLPRILRESCIADVSTIASEDIATAYLGLSQTERARAGTGNCSRAALDLFAAELCEPLDPALDMPAYSLSTNAALAISGSAAVLIDARSDIFSAGLPQADPARRGVLPARLALDPAGTRISFGEVHGTIGCKADSASGPDGGPCAGGETNLESAGSVSGIIAPGRTLFLVGLFMPEGSAAEPPSRLDFSPQGLGVSFETLAPALGQTFFIGDGVSDVGQTQQFDIPSGARSLYLGFADGFDFRGRPGRYEDNRGALAARVREQ